MLDVLLLMAFSLLFWKYVRFEFVVDLWEIRLELRHRDNIPVSQPCDLEFDRLLFTDLLLLSLSLFLVKLFHGTNGLRLKCMLVAIRVPILIKV